jgi:hypothetical protein
MVVVGYNLIIDMKKLLIIILWLISISLNAATYYVAPSTASPAGNDSNPGTIGAPWLTWNHAASVAVAGDIVYFRGGVYHLSNTTSGGGEWMSQHSGTHANPIRFFAYPMDYAAGNYPILDCSNSASMGTGHNYGITLGGGTYIHLKGLEIRNCYQKITNVLSTGIQAWNPHHITLENMRIHRISGQGMYLMPGNNDTVIVKNCDVWNNADTLNPVYSGGLGAGILLAFHGVGGGNSTGYARVTGCRVWKVSDTGYSCGNVSEGGTAVFDSCWAFNEGGLLGDGVGFKFAQSHVAYTGLRRTISHCIATHCHDRSGSGGDSGHGIAENTQIAGLVRQNVHVYNNFCYHNDWGFQNGSAITPSPDGQNLYRNNLSYANTLGNTTFGGVTYHDHNTWDSQVTVTVADFISLDTTGMAGSRQANGNLPVISFGKLTSTSDLIDAGINVGFAYSGSAPDLGWSEYSAQSPPVYPAVILVTGINVGNHQATVGCNVTDNGGGTVTARGVCWGISANPTTAGLHTTDGSGTGTFNSYITGLNGSTLYHVRAYAVNSAGTGYSTDQSFTTTPDLTTPVLTTTSISNIQQTTATSGGNITSAGYGTVTARGVCWSTSQNPTIEKSLGNTEIYSSANTDAYIRAVPVIFTEAGTILSISIYHDTGTGNFLLGVYSDVAGSPSTRLGVTSSTAVSGTTGWQTVTLISPVSVTLGQKIWLSWVFQTNPGVRYIEGSTQRALGTTTWSGGMPDPFGTSTFTYYSFSIYCNYYTGILGNKTTDGSGTGSFVSSLTSLTASTTYYVRAYATNEMGNGYGDQLTFITASAVNIPEVTTSVITDITSITATGGGNVTHDGGETVTTRGICWSTSPMPTISDSKTTDGSGEGSFVSSLTGLTNTYVYYVRAYATNSVGTGYGGQVSFTATDAIPSNLQGDYVMINGKILMVGNKVVIIH